MVMRELAPAPISIDIDGELCLDGRTIDELINELIDERILSPLTAPGRTGDTLRQPALIARDLLDGFAQILPCSVRVVMSWTAFVAGAGPAPGRWGSVARGTGAATGSLFVTRFALPYCPAASLCAGQVQVRRPVAAEVHGGREVGKSVAARR
ncbi:hypothetical protein ACUN29_04775 [Streptomyces sp. WC2508]|uniref:hypothetical protein n=1 Tax=Streptomyces sp. WC2508 TaxID=3461405 RepID=UPI004044F751